MLVLLDQVSLKVFFTGVSGKMDDPLLQERILNGVAQSYGSNSYEDDTLPIFHPQCN